MSPGKILGQGEGQNSIISSDDVKHGVNVPAFGEREKGKEEERDDQSFKRDSNEAKPYVSSNESDPQSAEKIVPLFPLHAAIKARELERIKSLLADQAVDINARDLKDRTALAYAVRDGLSEIVKYLCEAGAKAQLLPNNGYDAVLSAAEDGEADIVIALINAGANVNAADNNGQTLLHHAAKHGQGELIRMLVKAGANVNTKDKFSHDPLYYAARNSSLSSSFQAAATLLLKESRKAIEKAVNDHADAGNAAARKLFSQQVPRLNEKEGLISRNLNCIFAPPPVAPNSKQVEIAVGDNPRVK
jgi:ankyrin repeat protein